MIPTGQPDARPDNRPARLPDYMDSTDAAQTLGISLDALRKRIARGTIDAIKEGGHWYVRSPDNQPATDRPDDRPQPDSAQEHVAGAELVLVVEELRTRCQSLEEQLGVKDTQIGELHRLMATTALNAAPARPWWRFWG